MCLFGTHEVPGRQWQLGSPSVALGSFALIGWTTDNVRGRVPGPVVAALSRTLSEYGRVTFPCSTVSASHARTWQRQGDDFVVRYRTRSFLGRILAHLSSGSPADLILLSTVREGPLRQLFDDPGYPW